SPVNPDDPTKPVTPDDNVTPGTAGPLSIDFASNFYFGEQEISTEDKVYYSASQSFNGGTAGPNYVQVTDRRGTLEGWKLSVKQQAQFKTAEDDQLVGAAITLKNASVNSTMAAEYAPTAPTSLAL